MGIEKVTDPIHLLNSDENILKVLEQSNLYLESLGDYSLTAPAGTYKICERNDQVGWWETLPFPGFTPNLTSCPT